jgi:mRNA interferase MazF
VKTPLSSDLALDASNPDFAATGLRVPSTLQLHRLMTAKTSLIRRDLGKLSPRLASELETRIKLLFGLR